ncbi:MAG: hypothetical protein ABI396_05980, partial [Ktedonobacteraceae bacterium]
EILRCAQNDMGVQNDRGQELGIAKTLPVQAPCGYPIGVKVRTTHRHGDLRRGIDCADDINAHDVRTTHRHGDLRRGGSGADAGRGRQRPLPSHLTPRPYGTPTSPHLNLTPIGYSLRVLWGGRVWLK